MGKKYKITNRIIEIVAVALLIEMGMLALFFSQYRLIVKNETIKSYQTLAGQIIGQFSSTKDEIENIVFQASYSNTVQDYLLEDNKKEIYKNLPYVREFLENVITVNSDILNIKIMNTSGGIVSSGDSSIFPDSLKIDRIAGNLLERKQSDGVFTEFYYYEVNGKFYFAYLLPVYSSYEKRGDGKVIGVCFVRCSLASLQRSVELIPMQQGANFIILDSENQILASSDKEKIGKCFQAESDMNLIVDKKNEVIFAQDKKRSQFILVSDEGLTLLYSIPNSMLTSDIPSVLTILLFGILAATVIISIATVMLIRNITHPITAMVEEMREVASQNKKKRLSVRAKNEIGMICLEINDMLERIERLNSEKIQTADELAKIKLLQKQTELSFLRSQINPHFLYNSLECIRGMALSYHAKEIESLTISLSKLYRYSLSARTMVPLKEELKCIVEYCNIMSIRFGKNYGLIIDVSEKVMEELVMSMLLQPIVENSFKHGFKSGIGSQIKVMAIDDGDYMQLIVSDDGKGMKADELCEIQEKLKKNVKQDISDSSIGIWNIQKRIQMQYGTACGLAVTVNEGAGITVTATIGKIEK